MLRLRQQESHHWDVIMLLMGGGTASGKTSIASEYAAQIDALLIHHDRYYRDIPHPLGYNF